MKKFSFVIFLFFSVVTFGQKIVVSGKVTDKETGEAIPFVSVFIKNENNVITTDFEGNYSIKTYSNDTLVFSYLGMKTQEIRANKNEINVSLLQDEVLAMPHTRLPYEELRIKWILPKTAVTKKDIENADNPKYNFKKNIERNIFIIYVSGLTSYYMDYEDLEFERKYKIKYSLNSTYKTDFLIEYNKLTFKYLKKKYRNLLLTEIRKDAFGLEKE